MNVHRSIWHIDDKIQLGLLGKKGQALVASAMPLRSHTLAEALTKFRQAEVNAAEDDPEDSPAEVFDLISQMLERAEITLTGFVHPSAAVEALRKGERPPDLVIYDWEYTSSVSDADHLMYLRALLQSSFCFVCIYTHKNPVDIDQRTEDILTEYPFQFLRAYRKADVSADQLILTAEECIKGTLASRLMSSLGPLMYATLGRALREFSAIPETAISQVPAPTTPGAVDHLAELLAELIGRDVAATAMGQTESRLETVTSFIAKLLGEEIPDCSPVREALQQLRKATQAAAEPPPDEATTIQGVRQFQSYQLYVRHATDRVVRGDIIALDAQRTVLVLTAPCHLEKFAKKTRNSLTYIPLYECDKNGWTTLTSGAGEVNIQPKTIRGTSISTKWGVGTELPLVLPSVPNGSAAGGLCDYFLIPDRVSFEPIDQTACGYTADDVLTISALQKQFKNAVRLATLSEPYLSPLLWAVAQHLFSPGAEDFLDMEYQRLVKRFKGQFQP